MHAARRAKRAKNQVATARRDSEGGGGSPVRLCWAGLLAASALLGCESRSAPPRPALSSEAPAVSRPAPEREAVPKMKVPIALLRRMKIEPPTSRPARLAFGAGGLGQLRPDALVVHALHGGADEKRYPVTEPRHLVKLRGGDLLALTGGGALRVAEQRKPARFPRVTLFPDAWVFPDLIRSDGFWVLQSGGHALFGYELSAAARPLLAPDVVAAVSSYDGRALGPLASGAFLYTIREGLAVTYPRGREMPVAYAAPDAWRILPTGRPDRAWLLESSGSVTLLELHPAHGKARARSRFDAGPGLYDASSDDRVLALLFLEQPDDAAWRLRVEIYDSAGQRLWRRALPALELGEENWAADVATRAEIAVDAQSESVAVGGADALELFRLASGDPL